LLSSESLQKQLPKTAIRSIQRLAKLMKQLDEKQNVAQMVSEVLASHYEKYAEATFKNANTRIEDLDQLADYASRYDGLEQFLSDLALVAGVTAEAVGSGEVPEERITLSTVHQAKGLEWRVVFILWLAEGRFPQAIAVRDQADEEEERRLFYVAATRAEEQLYLCHPRFEDPRTGPRRMLRLSRFLSELAGNDIPYERWSIEESAE
jgi:DNA helicase-2/ATP-dependent DNA helicase PcrA